MNDKDLNIALGKLFNGIELDTHKVELALIDDVNSALDKADRMYGNIQDGLIRSQKEAKSAAKEYKIALKDAEKALKKIKELGVGGNMDKLFTDKVNYAKNNVKLSEKAEQNIDKIISSL
jgi:hypothetical protein|tara:strand:- start:9440 stop:9799 length:360 start_codon:yes stop_codon:yes gene_type:complete